MPITHEVLLSLGFVELLNRPRRYVYKGVTGRLFNKAGTFHFHGFLPAISTVTDLKYMLMLINYQHQLTFTGYPIHDN